MPGRGIKEKFLLFRPSRKGISHWREESFLQQLSMNGSMLWAPNHNRYWAEICSDMSGRSFSGWTALRRDLAERSAGDTRKILYSSSLEFFNQSEIAWSEAAKASLYISGDIGGYLRSWRSDLNRMKTQLDNLSWCLDDDTTEKIDIVEKS